MRNRARTLTPLGAWLDWQLTLQGHTQDWLARRAGLDPSMLSRCRSGERHPSHSIVLAIARALELDGAACADLERLAGYQPSVMPAAVDVELLAAIRAVLDDETRSTENRAAFVSTIIAIARFWGGRERAMLRDTA